MGRTAIVSTGSESGRSGAFAALLLPDGGIADVRHKDESPVFQGFREAGATGLEPATSGVTGRRSNQLNYAPVTDGF
jgi:hypothetical protein